MGIRGIASLLERFKNLKPPKEFKKSIVQKVIQKHLGVTIETSKIEVRGTVVYLKISPLYKNEISIHQEEIRETFKKEGLQISRIV
jgi:hypothetical protein